MKLVIHTACNYATICRKRATVPECSDASLHRQVALLPGMTRQLQAKGQMGLPERQQHSFQKPFSQRVIMGANYASVGRGYCRGSRVHWTSPV